MKKITALAGIAFMTIAVPASAYTNPPDGEPTGNRGGATEVPAPPVAILFGLAAGVVLLRRKVA